MSQTTQPGRPDSGTGREHKPSQPPAESVRTQLNRILASASFSHSDRLRRFLHFAVEQKLRGEGARLKEYQIGLEVFDRRDTYDPRIDPIVRVEASRLRSKLRDFYSSEGLRDPIVIEFPKGSYAPVFRARRVSARAGARILEWFPKLGDGKGKAMAALGLVTLAAVVWAVALLRENQSLRTQLQESQRPVVEPEFSLLWGRLLAPGAKNYVVFGSPMFLSSETARFFFRWEGLNQGSDFRNSPKFQEMEQRFGPLTGPRYDYALMGDAKALQRLTVFFGRAGADLIALPAHQASWEDIKDGNIIFLGAQRMNPLLSRLPMQRDFEWDPDYNIINRSPLPGEQEKYSTQSHYDLLSYAVIAHLPGLRPHREMFLLNAHSAPGTLAAVDFVTQPDTVGELLGRIGISKGSPERKYFEMLLRVVVDKGASVKSEYVTHHLVHSGSQE